MGICGNHKQGRDTISLQQRSPITAADETNDNNRHAFPTQMGIIYYEKSQVILGNMPRAMALNCGVEQYLIALCFFEDQAQWLRNRRLNLNMGDVFGHYGRAPVNDPENVQEHVDIHCNNVIEIKFPRRHIVLASKGPANATPQDRENARLLKLVIEAAKHAHYNMYIFYKDENTEDCSPRWEWGHTETWINKGQNEMLEHYLHTTKLGLWYFCQTGSFMNVQNYFGSGDRK